MAKTDALADGLYSHFKKGGTYLHTLQTFDEPEENSGVQNKVQEGINLDTTSEVQSLYCSVCSFLYLSQEHYNTHLSCENHLKNAKKAERRKQAAENKAVKDNGVEEKVRPPATFFCFSCQVPFDELENFNIHKVGRKHKNKCQSLMSDGFTIPMEERWPEIIVSFYELKNPAVYPPGYEDEVLQKTPVGDVEAAWKESLATEIKCRVCEIIFERQDQLDTHLATEEHALKILELRNSGYHSNVTLKRVMADRKICTPDPYGWRFCSVCSVVCFNDKEFKQHLGSQMHNDAMKIYEDARLLEIAMDPERRGRKFFCKYCGKSKSNLVAFNEHLHLAKHRVHTPKILANQAGQFDWTGPRFPGKSLEVGTPWGPMNRNPGRNMGNFQIPCPPPFLMPNFPNPDLFCNPFGPLAQLGFLAADGGSDMGALPFRERAMFSSRVNRVPPPIVSNIPPPAPLVPTRDEVLRYGPSWSRYAPYDAPRPKYKYKSF